MREKIAPCAHHPKQASEIASVAMSTVVISYFESERNLLWTEEIEQSRLGDALVDAQSRGETARAAEIEAAQAKLAKERAPFEHNIDPWKRVAAKVRVMR